METKHPKPSDLLTFPRKTHSLNPSSPSDRGDVDAKHQPSWSTQTPTKFPHLPPRVLRVGPSDQLSKLPDDYEMLLRLFNGLNSAIRLLKMRKSVPVFSKLRALVESITESRMELLSTRSRDLACWLVFRRFTHGHLAQMKFLLQEEIAIRMVSSPDEKTGCMKRDLLVSLKYHHGKKEKKRKHEMNDDIFSLKKLFRGRLLEFLRAHPEGTEIPEENLPDPFNKPKEDLNKAYGANFLSEVSTINKDADTKLTAASHFPQSFSRHFSQRKDQGGSPYCQLPNTTVQTSPLVVLEASHISPSIKSVALSDTSVFSGFTEGSNEAGEDGTALPFFSPGTLLKTPNLHPPRKISGLKSNDNLMKATQKSDSRPSCARSLQFHDAVETANIELELVDTETKDIVDVIPQGLLQSLKEKEKNNERHSLSPLVMNGLPKLFDRIYYLFQSHKYTTIRKEELLQTLTTCHGDITDLSEVVKQLKLLQEVIPEWILEKLSPSRRKILLSIDKALDPCMLRARVNQAACARGG